VSDIFQEVEEEVRRERLDKIWKEYGDYIVAAACLIVIAAAGFQLWRVYEQRESAKASEAYTQAENLYESGQTDLAAQAFAHIAATAPSGYSAIARLQEADAMMAAGKKDDAIAVYKKIAAGDNRLLGEVARLHQAWAIVDSAPRGEVQAVLAPLTDPSSAWRYNAQEILAYSDYRNGDTDKAAKAFTSLAATPGLTGQLHTRAMAMATFLNAGGDKNYGTVPPPPEEALQAAATGAAQPKPSAPPPATAQGPQKK
jgi:hypothetical protein